MTTQEDYKVFEERSRNMKSITFYVIMHTFRKLDPPQRKDFEDRMRTVMMQERKEHHPKE